MLIDQLKRQDKSQAALLTHQCALDTLHWAPFDSNPLANHEISVGLQPATPEIGTKELDFGVRNGNGPLAVPNNSQNAWRTKNRRSLLAVKPCKDIGRKKGETIFTRRLFFHIRTLS